MGLRSFAASAPFCGKRDAPIDWRPGTPPETPLKMARPSMGMYPTSRPCAARRLGRFSSSDGLHPLGLSRRVWTERVGVGLDSGGPATRVVPPIEPLFPTCAIPATPGGRVCGGGGGGGTARPRTEPEPEPEPDPDAHSHSRMVAEAVGGTRS